MPLLGAFASGKRGVKNRHFIAEYLIQIGRNSGRKADFRHEQNGRSSGIEHRFHGRQIYGRLAGSGYTVQQHAFELTCRDSFLNMPKGVLLCGVEIEIKR